MNDDARAQLWAFDELVSAAAGTTSGQPSRPITGVSIDTRTLAAGDLFAALKDQRDGHEFVGRAFAAGAAAALVSQDYERQPGDGALIRVAETLRGLESIARVARARLRPVARVIAVTGSAGKTGTKEMLCICLGACGRVHASEKSYNNHWGVPLTLARMPAGTDFAVIEIGMNHAGEIAPLTRLACPHVAIVTTVVPVHLAFFPSVADIAEAKAEIFLGLEPGGAAALNRDNEHFDLLSRRAAEAGARIVAFGRDDRADVRLVALALTADGSEITADFAGRTYTYRLGAPGEHLALNSLAALAAMREVGADIGTALASMAAVRPAPGRGARELLKGGQGDVLLIDESYNANPASMRAALEVLATVPRTQFKRRIAVLGDMLELGAEAKRLHQGLKEAVDVSGADLVFASGPNMAHLYALLDSRLQGAWAETSDSLRDRLLETVAAGDVVMVKGSLGSRMAPLVEALRARFAGGHDKI